MARALSPMEQRKRAMLEPQTPLQTPLQTALTPTEMPAPGDAQVARSNLAAQRAVKKRKGRASTILTGLFGRGGLSAPLTALSGTSPSLDAGSILDEDGSFWEDRLDILETLETLDRTKRPGDPRRARRTR